MNNPTPGSPLNERELDLLEFIREHDPIQPRHWVLRLLDAIRAFFGKGALAIKTIVGGNSRG